MKIIDRILLGVLAAGVWAAVAAYTLKPQTADAYAHSLDSSDVRRIVEDCSVDGQVYIYGMPYGQIINGSISC